MAINSARLSDLFILETVYSSSVFSLVYIDQVVAVLLSRGVFFIVEPYTDRHAMVFVKQNDLSLLKDLVRLTTRPYPFAEDIAVEASLFDWAKNCNLMIWEIMGEDFFFVNPTVLHEHLSKKDGNSLTENEAYFLAAANKAIYRGVQELRFHRQDK